MPPKNSVTNPSHLCFMTSKRILSHAHLKGKGRTRVGSPCIEVPQSDLSLFFVFLFVFHLLDFVKAHPGVTWIIYISYLILLVSYIAYSLWPSSHFYMLSQKCSWLYFVHFGRCIGATQYTMNIQPLSKKFEYSLKEKFTYLHNSIQNFKLS